MLRAINTLSRAQIRKLLIKSTAIFCITVFVGYGLFVSRNLIKGPELYIASPENGISTTSPYIHVTGNILRVKELTLNNRPITVSLDGNFSETIILFPGYNVFVFNATDKFNRTINRQLEVVRLNK